MRGHRLLTSLAVTAALLTPGLGQAIAAAQTRAAVRVGPVTIRVYDRTHKEYHVWDKQEDQHRAYLRQHHQKYRPITKISRARQASYWNARHEPHGR